MKAFRVKLLPYVQVAHALDGSPTMPAAPQSDAVERPHGTIGLSLALHGKFTGAGPYFEDCDEAILEGVLPAEATKERWLIAFCLPQFHAIDANDNLRDRDLQSCVSTSAA